MVYYCASLFCFAPKLMLLLFMLTTTLLKEISTLQPSEMILIMVLLQAQCVKLL